MFLSNIFLKKKKVSRSSTSSLWMIFGVGISIKYLIRDCLPGYVGPLWRIGRIGNGIEKFLIDGSWIRRYKFNCWIFEVIKRQVKDIPVINNWPANDDGSGSSGMISIVWISLLILENRKRSRVKNYV